MSKIFVQLLIDRTGSMAARWGETITAINAYIGKVIEPANIDARIGLAFFDRSPPDPVLQWKPEIERGAWVPLSAADPQIHPRGMTPLFDAIVEVAGKLQSRPKTPDERVQFVVMTDGEENSSQEATLDTVQKSIAALEASGVPVTFLGAGVGAFKQGAVMGTQAAQTAFVGAKGMAATMDCLAVKTRAYAKSGDSASLRYTSEDRAKMSADS